MHAATKGSAFGVVLMMLGVALHFRDSWVTTEALLVIVFIFMTAPIAGYVIARAAHTLRTPMAKETVIDELMEREKEKNGDITREQ
jgi:multicomponent Na+:H+ antiporter subunit G